MTTQLTKKDFVSNQEIRWCPGCGDYGILAAVQKTLPELGVPLEKFAFISGIGCSSRFPYYINTYGFHTIHGRAPAVASGLKIANPDLSVWVITGDGDGLSIGGNHLIHAIRRNLDINIIFFNNRIYGLTKGQFSPTSALGSITKSSPYGTIDPPFRPLSVVIGAEATFAARTYDKSQKHMSETIEAAFRHKGTSFIEVLQNCAIFNDGVHDDVYGKDVRDDTTVLLEHGKPLIFGANHDKGIVMEGSAVRVVSLSEVPAEKIHVHDETVPSPDYAFLLSRMENPEFPVPMGVLRNVKAPVYEDMVQAQIQTAIDKKGEGSLQDLICTEDTWEIK